MGEGPEYLDYLGRHSWQTDKNSLRKDERIHSIGVHFALSFKHALLFYQILRDPTPNQADKKAFAAMRIEGNIKDNIYSNGHICIPFSYGKMDGIPS